MKTDNSKVNVNALNRIKELEKALSKLIEETEGYFPESPTDRHHLNKARDLAEKALK